MDKTQRIKRLREVEEICYRLCYALLDSEVLAHGAAKEALCRLWRDDRFFEGEADQTKLLRRHASAACLSFFKRAKTHTIA
ncbi:hypothetical protein [Paenibacillus radicis (ex Gao et al. 2016)]|uniref:Uncharacterized protein n=1 Tax=Paenibacillus radicis (ex Gao et al. 2016) TaxID=1737354 RepID=A0A917M8T0_9BACL|nr:hypothetical protein [Paenibacillus radicis (ex Gao et al. 2016)]GGG84673.1 hypothetical protein GCM10010918_48170 [Paenibacillus radicis (ex Gao et al. 2016)]